MAYAAGRVICDADSHIMESGDWLPSYADPTIRERLMGLRLGSGQLLPRGSEAAKAIEAALRRQGDSVATAAIADNVIAGPKGWAAYGAMNAQERARALDDLGFSRQLVFTTFAGTQFMYSQDPEVKYGGVRALNRAIADWCSVDRRLIPVGVAPLDDLDRALCEIEAAIDGGCGAIWMTAGPAGNRSPGHPDLDPIWRRLSDAGIPFVLHVGAAVPEVQEAYHYNGHPRTEAVGESISAKHFFAASFAAQNFLCALVLDGVFDRFPTLRGGVIELGAGWVPDMLRRLDQTWIGWRKRDAAVGSLSMPPSELVRRAVRFTPSVTEDVGRIIRDGGPELFLFSSDFPHPEGSKNPIARFENTFGDLDDGVRDAFYRRNFEHLFAS